MSLPPLRFIPFCQPVIDKVEPQILEWHTNARLTIIGRNLKAERVSIIFWQHKAVTLQTEDVTDNQISVKIPDESTAGVKSVQVVHPLKLGKPKFEHRGIESNEAAFVLAPKITTSEESLVIAKGSFLTVEFEPAATSEQKVAILVGDFTFPVPSRDPKSNPVKKLSIKIPADFSVGEYLLRLRVDGAESFLEVDGGQFAGPKVTVT